MQDNIIYCTKEYSIFKKLYGNRDILDSRKNTIKNSILENGYIRNPIVVNENLEIIDGQGRFEALKELGLPIEYVIAHGAGHKECIALNANQKNWKTSDYVKSYAEIGIKEYVFVHEMCKMFPNLDQANIVGVCMKVNNGGGSVSRYIKSGKLKLYHEETIPERLKLYEKLHNIICGDADFGIQRAYAGLVTFLYECKEIDEEKVLRHIQKYKEYISPSFNIKQALKNMEFVYNRCSKKYVYFSPLFDEWNKGN